LKPKAVALEAKHAVAGTRPRARVVLTSCLGHCPKGATSIGVAGSLGCASVGAVTTRGQVAKVVSLLIPPAPPAVEK
jgi:hypothetical protein